MEPIIGHNVGREHKDSRDITQTAYNQNMFFIIYFNPKYIVGKVV